LILYPDPASNMDYLANLVGIAVH